MLPTREMLLLPVLNKSNEQRISLAHTHARNLLRRTGLVPRRTYQDTTDTILSPARVINTKSRRKHIKRHESTSQVAQRVMIYTRGYDTFTARDHDPILLSHTWVPYIHTTLTTNSHRRCTMGGCRPAMFRSLAYVYILCPRDNDTKS